MLISAKQFQLRLKKSEIVSFKTHLNIQVIITSFTCKIFGSQNSMLYQKLISAKQFQLEFTKKFSKLCRLRHPSIFKYNSNLPPVKFFGSQNKILYQQLISAKQFQLELTKNFQIVSFKTPLDLQVTITSFTCKISWVTEWNLFQFLVQYYGGFSIINY